MRLNRVGSVAVTAAAAGAGLYLAVLRPRHVRWGATDEEVNAVLPGDDLVQTPKLSTTRAVTIHAPVADVWAWLVQIGQGRGGFYSYDRLENLAGADIHTVDSIVPELQELRVGDLVRLAPEPGPAMEVTILEPRRALVLYAAMDPQSGRTIDLTDAPPEQYSVGSWAFVLGAIDERTTRLIVRFRLDWSPSLANFIIWRVLTEPAHFVMERKMLLTIKALAERSAPVAGEMLIDRYLPVSESGFRYEVIVDAGCEETYAAAKRVDKLMQTEPVVLALSELRMLPERLLHRLRGDRRPAPEASMAPSVGETEEPPFVLLAEEPGREYVMGLIGQFWESDAGMLRIDPDEFAGFDRPGYAKTAFNFAVQPYGDGRTLLSTETRIVGTDDESRRQFRRYWRIIGPGAGLIMRRLLHRIKDDAETVNREAALP